MNETWVKPENMSGLATVNWWLALIPVGMIVIGALIPLLKIPGWAAWVNYAVLTFLGASLLAMMMFYLPAKAEAATDASYLSWFHENYSDTELTDSQALQILHYQAGYLDEDKKVNYILHSSEGDNETLIYELTTKNPYHYEEVSQAK